MTLPKGVRAVRKTRADGTVAVYYYDRATNTRLPDPTDPKFRKALADAKTSYRVGRYPLGTVGAVITAYRSSPEWRAKKPQTQRFNLTQMRPLEELYQLEFSTIKRAHIIGIRNAIAATRGPAAANAFASITRALFSWARDTGLIEHSPLDRMKSIPGGHWPAWTERHYEQALEHFPEYLRRVVILARYTGQRRGDLIRMSWSQYDGQTIRVRQQKTGADLVIPLHPILKAELDDWKRDATSIRILTTERGRVWDNEYLSEKMGDWCKQLGMPGLNVHGLRKLAAASLAQAGCQAKEIMAITGHRTLAMVALYTESADQEQLANAAIFKLRNVLAKSDKK
jgi:integrase